MVIGYGSPGVKGSLTLATSERQVNFCIRMFECQVPRPGGVHREGRVTNWACEDCLLWVYTESVDESSTPMIASRLQRIGYEKRTPLSRQ